MIYEITLISNSIHKTFTRYAPKLETVKICAENLAKRFCVEHYATIFISEAGETVAIKSVRTGWKIINA